jgi:DNA-directed RNA polymerase subunit RPC12/RpoP
MFIIIPVRRRYTIYYCPRCRSRLRFFSWIPISKPEWTCRRCGKKIQIKASCIATNWAYGFTIWGMLLAGLICGPLGAISAAVAHYPAGTTFIKRLAAVVIGFVAAIPAGALLALLPCLILGYLVGLVYGMFAVNAPYVPTERNRPRRKRRTRDYDALDS